MAYRVCFHSVARAPLRHAPSATVARIDPVGAASQVREGPQVAGREVVGQDEAQERVDVRLAPDDDGEVERAGGVHGRSILMENILKITKEGIEKGTIRRVDADLLAYFFFMIDEAAVQRLALDDKYTIKEIMSFVADMIAFGFLTNKGKAELENYRRRKVSLSTGAK